MMSLPAARSATGKEMIWFLKAFVKTPPILLTVVAIVAALSRNWVEFSGPGDFAVAAQASFALFVSILILAFWAAGVYVIARPSEATGSWNVVVAAIVVALAIALGIGTSEWVGYLSRLHPQKPSLALLSSVAGSLAVFGWFGGSWKVAQAIEDGGANRRDHGAGIDRRGFYLSYLARNLAFSIQDQEAADPEWGLTLPVWRALSG